MNSSVSYIKKMNNEMSQFEAANDKSLNNEKDVVVHLKIQNSGSGDDEQKSKLSNSSSQDTLVKSLLKKLNCSSAYIFTLGAITFIWLIFAASTLSKESILSKLPSVVKDNDGRLKPSNFSAYVTNVASHIITQNGFVSSSTIPDIASEAYVFNSNLHTFAYLNWRSYENTSQLLLHLSKGKITRKDLTFLTRGEIINRLKEKCDVEFDKVVPRQKYGTLFNLKNGNICSKSIPLDFCNYDTHRSFLFST